MGNHTVLKKLSRSRLGLAFVLIVATWAWAAFFAPWWVFVPSLLLTLAAVAMISFSTPTLQPRRSTDDQSLRDEQIKQMRQDNAETIGGMSKAIFGLQQMLGRWGKVSQHAHGDLQRVHDGVEEVMIQTEQAVIDIGNSFLDITKKTSLQIEYAVRLLKSADVESKSGDGLASWLGLPDYIRAYEAQLHLITARMQEFSATSKEVGTYESRMHQHTCVVDELLDELRSIARRIGTLAVDSSYYTSGVTSGTGHTAGREITDKIRAVAEEAHEVTRSIRKNLETIKAQISVTYKAVRDSSNVARLTAQQAEADVAQLNVTMIEKTREVEETFERINGLGKEIRNDISKIIIAMQFQDLTKQKLERLKEPTLGVIQTLQAIFEEADQTTNKTDSLPGAAANPASATNAAPKIATTSVKPEQTGTADGDNRAELF